MTASAPAPHATGRRARASERTTAMTAPAYLATTSRTGTAPPLPHLAG